MRSRVQEYMLGDQNQSVLPVAFSLMASFVSAITMFGVSSEVFSRGTQFSVIVVSYVIATPIIGYVYLPVFFKLGNLSLYEVTYKKDLYFSFSNANNNSVVQKTRIDNVLIQFQNANRVFSFQSDD